MRRGRATPDRSATAVPVTHAEGPRAASTPATDATRQAESQPGSQAEACDVTTPDLPQPPQAPPEDVSPPLPAFSPRVVARATTAQPEVRDLWTQDPEEAPPPRDDPGVTAAASHAPPPVGKLKPETTAKAPDNQTRLQLLSISEILALPDPDWLINLLFTRGALVITYGPSGGGKSFVVLDWALSIAACLDQWLGHKVVSAGRVVYVVGEGKGGIRKRIKAWLEEHGRTTVLGAFCLLEPPQLLHEADINLFLMRITALRPVLVVLDTFATCFDGDENHPKDMSNAIAAAKRIIRDTGATVILVHHSGKRGLEERGHSAMRAAADTMILVEAKNDAFGGKLIEITNTKQKDSDEFPKITVRLKRVPVGTSAEGEALTSCVLELNDAPPAAPDDLNAGQRQALSVLVEKFPEGVYTTQWRTALAEGTRVSLPKKTFQNYRKALVERGLAETVAGRKNHYRATDAGKMLLSAPLSNSAVPEVGDSTAAAEPTVPVPQVSQSMPDGTHPLECQPHCPPLGAVALAQGHTLRGGRLDA